MAIWQFKVQIIQEEQLAGRDYLPSEEWQEGIWWNRGQPQQELISDLSSLLPPQESWSEDLSQWGKQDSNLIEIWREGEKVESISARIDTRELDIKFIKSLVNIVGKWECRMVYARYRTVQPTNYEQFIKAILDSPSSKVVDNPGEWLPKMAQEVANEDKNH